MPQRSEKYYIKKRGSSDNTNYGEKEGGVSGEKLVGVGRRGRIGSLDGEEKVGGQKNRLSYTFYSKILTNFWGFSRPNSNPGIFDSHFFKSHTRLSCVAASFSTLNTPSIACGGLRQLVQVGKQVLSSIILLRFFSQAVSQHGSRSTSGSCSLQALPRCTV